MKITQPTYLIAELEGPVVPFVKRLRNKHNPDRKSWPVEITIAGSSGIGVLENGQILSEIVDLLNPVIREHGFVSVNFERLSRFQDTGIVFLAPHRTGFDRLHEAVAQSGVRFEGNPFPYNPHCTVKAGAPREDDYSIERLRFPKTARIRCFSLYQPEPYGGKRIYRFEHSTIANHSPLPSPPGVDD